MSKSVHCSPRAHTQTDRHESEYRGHPFRIDPISSWKCQVLRIAFSPSTSSWSGVRYMMSIVHPNSVRIHCTTLRYVKVIGARKAVTLAQQSQCWLWWHRSSDTDDRTNDRLDTYTSSNNLNAELQRTVPCMKYNSQGATGRSVPYPKIYEIKNRNTNMHMK